MMLKSHLVFGAASVPIAACAGAITIPSLGGSNIAIAASSALSLSVMVAAAMAGATVPDIDTPQSWLGRRCRGLSDILSAAVGHRGIVHSLFGAVAFSAVVMWGLGELGLGAFPLAAALGQSTIIGYLSHLIADSFVDGGIPLLLPSMGRRWKLRLPFIFTTAGTTGGLLERFVLVPAAALLGAVAAVDVISRTTMLSHIVTKLIGG